MSSETDRELGATMRSGAFPVPKRANSLSIQFLRAKEETGAWSFRRHLASYTVLMMISDVLRGEYKGVFKDPS
jgi:hypothetical protein